MMMTIRGKEGAQLPLAVAEMHIIDAILNYFIENFRHRVSPLQHHDTIIQACERLRNYLSASFFPRKDDDKK